MPKPCRLPFLAAAWSLPLLAACAGPTIHWDVDKTADFSAYHSFGFHEPFGLDRDGVRTPLGNTVRDAVTAELQRRGLKPAESGAQLLVNAGGMLTQKQRVDSMPGGYYGYRYGRYAGWTGYSEVTVTDYTEGTLTIDVIDPARRQMVWSATAVDQVTASDREHRDENLPPIIRDMFESFPIAPAQPPAGS
jgi:hypothetical protein